MAPTGAGQRAFREVCLDAASPDHTVAVLYEAVLDSVRVESSMENDLNPKELGQGMLKVFWGQTHALPTTSKASQISRMVDVQPI